MKKEPKFLKFSLITPQISRYLFKKGQKFLAHFVRRKFYVWRPLAVIVFVRAWGCRPPSGNLAPRRVNPGATPEWRRAIFITFNSFSLTTSFLGRCWLLHGRIVHRPVYFVCWCQFAPQACYQLLFMLHSFECVQLFMYLLSWAPTDGGQEGHVLHL